MRKRADSGTLDLFAWSLPEIAPRLDEDQVRASSLRDRVARAVALILRESPFDRDEIVARMSEFLGEPMTRPMLDAYASQGRSEHTISAIRLVALAHATQDLRVLQILLDPFDHVLIPARYLPAIEAELLDDKIEEMTSRRQAVRRQWKGPRR